MLSRRLGRENHIHPKDRYGQLWRFTFLGAQDTMVRKYDIRKLLSLDIGNRHAWNYEATVYHIRRNAIRLNNYDSKKTTKVVTVVFGPTTQYFMFFMRKYKQSSSVLNSIWMGFTAVRR